MTVAAFAAAALMAGSAHAGVIFESSFENGFTDWSHTSDWLAVTSAVAPDGTKLAEGLCFDLQTCPTSSALSHVLTTVAGQAYEVSFDFSPQPFVGIDPTQSSFLEVLAAGSSLSISNVADRSFQTYTLDFTATGSTTTLTFKDANIGRGIGLDDVKVTAVPEPAAWALMILGFGGVGLALRKSQRKRLLTIAATSAAALALAACGDSGTTSQPVADPGGTAAASSPPPPVQAATEAPAQAQPVSASDDDLRAAHDAAADLFDKTYKSEGMAGVVGAIKQCYGKLGDSSTPKARAKCVYLDTTTAKFEGTVDPQFRAVDMENMPDLTGKSMDARIGPQLAILANSDVKADKMAFAKRMAGF